MDKELVLVINGYGCHLDTPLKPYLDRVVRFIREEKPSHVIFCGGFTQLKSTPGVAEGHLMCRYVTDKFDQHGYGLFEYRIEGLSYTTYENSQKSAEIIRTGIYEGKPLRIVVFCEATRSANVIMLGRHFYKDFLETIDVLTVETASWERADPFKQAGNLIYNWLAIRFPYLARREHNRRAKRSFQI